MIPHRENLKIHLKINLLEMRGMVTLREKGGKYWRGVMGSCPGCWLILDALIHLQLNPLAIMH